MKQFSHPVISIALPVWAFLFYGKREWTLSFKEAREHVTLRTWNKVYGLDSWVTALVRDRNHPDYLYPNALPSTMQPGVPLHAEGGDGATDVDDAGPDGAQDFRATDAVTVDEMTSADEASDGPGLQAEDI